jgi:hypothetical protein
MESAATDRSRKSAHTSLVVCIIKEVLWDNSCVMLLVALLQIVVQIIWRGWTRKEDFSGYWWSTRRTPAAGHLATSLWMPLRAAGSHCSFVSLINRRSEEGLVAKNYSNYEKVI